MQGRGGRRAAARGPRRGHPSARHFPPPWNPPPCEPRASSPGQLGAGMAAGKRGPTHRRAPHPGAQSARPSRKLRAAARGRSAAESPGARERDGTVRVPEAGAALSRVGVAQINSWVLKKEKRKKTQLKWRFSLKPTIAPLLGIPDLVSPMINH